MIRLQFTRVEGDPVSDLIAWFGRLAQVSHVDAVLPDGRLLGARIEGGVLIRPPGYQKVTSRVVVELPGDDKNDAFYSFLHAQIGKPYDRTAVLAFAARRDWQEPDSWFCSELIAAALIHAGWFPFPPVAPANKISPADLLFLLSAFVEMPAAWSDGA